ncbi:hypothetical protein T439DRAFT_326775 [Meredithblackwellia eburnea MCA 4105]
MPCLPVEAPAGVNPYAFYKDYLVRDFYQQPAYGFKGRMIALGCMLAVGLCLTLTRLCLKILHGYRSGSISSALWVWRNVKRPNRTWFVVSRENIGIFLNTICLSAFLAYVQFEYKIFIYHYDQAWAATIRSLVWLPFALQGWTVANASFHSHCVVTESQGKHWPRWLPLASTIFFFSSIGLFLTAAIVLITITNREWQGLWERYRDLYDLLATWSATWEQTGDNSESKQMYKTFWDLIAAAEAHRKAETALKAVYLAIFIGNGVINLANLSVYLVIRRQLRLNALHMTPKAAEFDSNIILDDIDDIDLGMEAARGDNLKHAARSVLNFGIAICVVSITFATVFAWTLSVPSISFAGDIGWAKIELSLFLNLWIYATLVLILGVRLLIDSWRQLPARSTTPRVPANILRGAPGNPGVPDTLDTYFQDKDRQRRILLMQNNSSYSGNDQPIPTPLVATVSLDCRASSVDGVGTTSSIPPDLEKGDLKERDLATL